MNWFCFLNRIALRLGWAEIYKGHYFKTSIDNGYRCVRCGFKRPRFEKEAQ